MFPTNPQCGSQAVCIPLVAWLLLIKLSLTRAEMTKKQLVCAKDVHDEAASCLEGICIYTEEIFPLHQSIHFPFSSHDAF